MKKYMIGSAFSLVLGLTAAFAAEDTFEFERGANKIKMTFQHAAKDSDEKIMEKESEASPLKESDSKPVVKGLLGAEISEEMQGIKTIEDMVQYCINKKKTFNYVLKGQSAVLPFYYPEGQYNTNIVGYNDSAKTIRAILWRDEISRITVSLL